jgi:hypothetical protein
MVTLSRFYILLFPLYHTALPLVTYTYATRPMQNNAKYDDVKTQADNKFGCRRRVPNTAQLKVRYESAKVTNPYVTATQNRTPTPNPLVTQAV